MARYLVTGGAGFTPPLQPKATVREEIEGTTSRMHYVYVLRSTRMGTSYIGCTSDLRARVLSHQNGESLATKGKRPWELLYYEAYRHRADAYERERRLKQFGGAYRQLKRRLTHEFPSLVRRAGGSE